VHADLIARGQGRGWKTGILYVVCHGGTEHYEKNDKFVTCGEEAEGYIFGAEVLRLPRSTALRADGWNGMTPLRGSIFNRFGEVVSRRAGIIHLIDLYPEEGPVDTIVAGKKENFM